MPRRHPPFPYVGAGVARYSDEIAIAVHFARAPAATARKQIDAALPAGLATSWRGARVVVGNEVVIVPPGSRDERTLEATLVAIHAIAPIVVAVRAPDREAGGTTFSAWHRASLRMLPQIWERLKDVASAADDLRWIARLAREGGVALTAAQQALLDPAADLRVLATDENIGRVDAIVTALSQLAGKAAAGAAGVIASVAYLAAMHGDAHAQARIFAAIARLARASTDVRDKVAETATAMVTHRDRRYLRSALPLLEVLVRIRGIGFNFYTLALWAAIGDNNKLPIDRARHERFLAACVEQPGQAPALYHNAACLCIELGEPARAVALVRRALAAGQPHAKLDRDKVLAPLRSRADYQRLFVTRDRARRALPAKRARRR